MKPIALPAARVGLVASLAAAAVVLGLPGATAQGVGQRPDASISGRVVDPSGTPLSGVVVQVSAWPSNELLTSLSPGEAVPMIDLGTVLTDEMGMFALTAAEIPSTASVEDTDGSVNVESVAFGPDGQVVAARSFTQTADAHTTDSLGSAITMIAQSSAAEFRQQVAEADVTDEELLAAPAACGPVSGGSVGNYWTQVGRVASQTSSGYTASFTYTGSQSSTLGVGIKYAGGSWGVSGSSSVTRASSTSTTWPSLTGRGGRGFRTQFTYVLTKYICQGSGEQYRSVRPSTHVGGANYVITSASGTYCTSYGSGSTLTRTLSTAQTITGGVDISAYIGVDLSARTGYTTSAAVKFTFSTTRRLCGTQGYPGGTPGTLVVYNP